MIPTRRFPFPVSPQLVLISIPYRSNGHMHACPMIDTLSRYQSWIDNVTHPPHHQVRRLYWSSDWLPLFLRVTHFLVHFQPRSSTCRCAFLSPRAPDLLTSLPDVDAPTRAFLSRFSHIPLGRESVRCDTLLTLQYMGRPFRYVSVNLRLCAKSLIRLLWK